MIIQLLKSLTESYKWLPEAAGIIGLLLLAFKKGRKWIVGFLRGLYVWIVFPFKSQDIRKEILSEISGIKTELQKNTKISESTAKDVDELKKVVGYNGGSGLMDIIGYIEGLQNSDFWHRPNPGFICDGDGRNIEVTYSYCSLLGVSTKADLTGISWKSYTNSKDSTGYLSEFRESASRGECFRGKIELFNINSLSQGNWIIILNPISTQKAKTKRYVGLLYPADDISKEIANKHGWPLSVPI